MDEKIDIDAENQALNNKEKDEISSDDMPNFEMGGENFSSDFTDYADETENDSMLSLDDDFDYDPFAKNTLSEEPKDELDEYGLEDIVITLSSNSSESFHDYESTKEIIRMAENEDDSYGRNLSSFDNDLIEELGLTFVKEDEDPIAKTSNMIIDGFRIVVEEVKKSKINTATQIQTIADNNEISEEQTLKKVRTYKNVTPKMKIHYMNPKEESEGFTFKKFAIAVAISIVCGVLLGCQSNSYYLSAIANNEKPSPLQCVWEWLLKENIPFKITPLVSDIFATGFFVGASIFAVIALFYFLDAEQKRKMRVGHEQGNAHLCTASELKKYCRHFMD